MTECSSRSNCSTAACFTVKSSWRWNEQVFKGVKGKASCRLDTTLYSNLPVTFTKFVLCCSFSDSKTIDIGTMRTTLQLQAPNTQDLFTGAWHSSRSTDPVLYLVANHDIMPWQRPTTDVNFLWHRGDPLVVRIKHTCLSLFWDTNNLLSRVSSSRSQLLVTCCVVPSSIFLLPCPTRLHFHAFLSSHNTSLKYNNFCLRILKNVSSKCDAQVRGLKTV